MDANGSFIADQQHRECIPELAHDPHEDLSQDFLVYLLVKER
jgi:hypothetical protein